MADDLNAATDAIVVRTMRTDEAEIVSGHRRLAHAEARRYRGGERMPEDSTVPTVDGATGPGAVVLVATFRSTIIGSVIARERADREWVIDHVHVIEGARGAGAGDALMDGLIERLREAGARWVGSHALPGDREMKNLFERQGMTARLIEVGRSLD